jgi:Spy/CpxP family protein refolding chaperone
MNKLKTVLVFTLVIFVVSLCAPAVFGQVPQRGRRPMMQNQPREKLNIPDLSDEQMEQLKNLRENQREVQKQFMEKTENLRLKINELKQDAAANAVEIEKIQDTIFNLKIEQMKNAYQNQKEIRKIFTPEQLEKMSALRMRSSMFGRAAMQRRGLNRGRGQMFGRYRFFQRNIMRLRR